MTKEDEDYYIGDLKREFVHPDPERQKSMSFSPDEAAGNIAIAFYRGIELGKSMDKDANETREKLCDKVWNTNLFQKMYKQEMKDDLRYVKARERLSSLTSAELERIIYDIDMVLFDTDNFSEGKFCPIAVAMNLHNTLEEPSDDIVKNKISARFDPVNIFKGVEGKFYTRFRKQDLLFLCKDILTERGFYS